jgi:hypothetical protein
MHEPNNYTVYGEGCSQSILYCTFDIFRLLQGYFQSHDRRQKGNERNMMCINIHTGQIYSINTLAPEFFLKF